MTIDASTLVWSNGLGYDRSGGGPYYILAGGVALPLTGGSPYASLSLTSGASGKRQACGSAKYLQLNSAGSGSIYYRFTDGSAAIGVSSSDTLIAVNATLNYVGVPAGRPFFEYLQFSAGLTFTLGLMS